MCGWLLNHIIGGTDIMELEQKIFEQIVKRLDLDEETANELTNETILFDLGDGQENLGLDSIDALELVTLIYDNWDIDVPTEDMKKLYSVNAIADYVRSCGKG